MVENSLKNIIWLVIDFREFNPEVCEDIKGEKRKRALALFLFL